MDLRYLFFSFIYILVFHEVPAQDQKNSPRFCRSIFYVPATCVKLEHCERFLTLLKVNPGSTRLVITLSQCPESTRHHRVVCCPLPDKRQVPDLIEGPSKYKLLHPPECGYCKVAHDKLDGASTSASGAWPWVALVGFIESSNVIDFRCGGALISARHVLTSAQCADQFPRLVRLREYDVAHHMNASQTIEIFVEKVFIHPKYNRFTLQNDIGILRLIEEVPFTDHVHPICIPTEDDIKNRTFVGTYPFIAGWATLAHKSSESSVLLEGQAAVVDTEHCKDVYKNSTNAVVDDRTLCAGSTPDGKDACQGDAGGPLMLMDNQTYYVIGILSRGYLCTKPDHPNLYMRVSHYLDFIEKNLI